VSAAILMLSILAAGAAAVAGIIWHLRRQAGVRLEDAGSVAAAPDAPEVASGPGEELGPYRLLDKIGEGGMAEVYTAVVQESAGKGSKAGPPLVVKCLRPELVDDPLAVAHFMEEGRLSSSLVHPNIARVFQDGVADNRHYLVQEYVPGRDLGCVTRTMVASKQRPLSAAVILYLAHEILQALEYAHGKRSEDGRPLGVVHCDVSPENILVSLDGEVKLLDFGIARSGLVGEDGSGIKGNVDFMSPEQAQGLVVDPRSDLFSVGLVMYFCAARAPLYRTRSKTSTVFDRLARAAAGPGDEEWAFIAGLAPPLNEILPRVLAVDLAQRIQSARSLRHAIAPHIEGGAAELAATMQDLFGEAVAAEKARLQAAAGKTGPARRRAVVGV
jgi:serine/threonine protein kinase